MSNTSAEDARIQAVSPELIGDVVAAKLVHGNRMMPKHADRIQGHFDPNRVFISVSTPYPEFFHNSTWQGGVASTEYVMFSNTNKNNILAIWMNKECSLNSPQQTLHHMG